MLVAATVRAPAASAAAGGLGYRHRAAEFERQSPADRTTKDGVFNAEQASRGEETYMAICVSCHPRGTYATPAFRAAWTGRQLSELFDFVREKMPKNDPGTLTPGEYAQVIAYILTINDVPAGDHELPPDSEALRKIRIELPASP
jgi:mono/diheme cytochrome c family protein